MANTDKDTIYIDIDDEITGIIDKVRGSNSKLVALVLPKRASVFQSIVNMKLLKRAADSEKKNLVLITSEAGLLPLAGAAGIFVAKTLTSKPEIPEGPVKMDAEEAVNESEAEAIPLGATQEAPLDSNKPVGEYAGKKAAASASPVGTPPPKGEGVETVTLDDEDVPPEDEVKTAAAAATAAKAAKPKDKRLKIPNFKRFRLIAAGGVLLLILLIIGFVYADSSLDKATINIKTDATNVDASVDLTLSSTAKSVDSVNNIVPAKIEQQQKTYTQQVPTTGQKNNGNKSSGSITMTAQECAPNIGTTPNDVPAGTGVSANGLTYITQTDTTFNNNQISNGSGNCVTVKADNPTDIIAQNGGSNYNVSGVPFTVAGRSDVTANGSTQGGTDNMVQTVNQNDINNAQSKINTANSSTMKQTLDTQSKADGLYPLDATFSSGTPAITTSANVGDVASTVTVTETVTYTMFAVHKSDLQSIIDNNINGQIDTSKQSILDDGLSNASISVNSQAATSAAISLSTTAVVGPQLNVNAIKTAAEGQKEGAIKSQLSSNPDVTSVTVSFSPFWNDSAPKDINKITVNIAKPTTTLHH